MTERKRGFFEEKSLNLLQLFLWRAQASGIWPSPKEDPSGIVGKIIYPYKWDFKEKDKDDLVDELKQTRERAKIKDRTPTRPALCAQYIMDQCNERLARYYSEKALKKMPPPDFIVWYDAVEGMRTVAEPIFFAEMNIRGISEAVIASRITAFDQVVSQLIKVNPDFSFLVKSTDQYKKEFSEAEELLKLDHNGYGLINEGVRKVTKDFSEIREENLKTRVYVPEFVIEGAKLAQFMYQRLYPLSENS
ncbi:MAG: hypothetical protein M1268_01900 [Patescibacteria group bacterium]|nr:hypothetical protein [Patescibacteria group bacterium]